MTQKTFPLVSIIMPCYNSSDYISEAIESILAQVYSDWELIIVDDASDDCSLKIIEQFALKDSRIVCMSLNQNVGPAKARNKAVDSAKGRYIAFLDADDVWPVDKLSLQVDFMIKNPCALSYGGFQYIAEDGTRLSKFLPKLSTSYVQLLKRAGFNLCTVMYDVNILGKLKMESNTISEDYTIWLRVLKKGHIALGMNHVLAYYRKVPGSVSSNKFHALKARWAILRSQERVSFLRAVIYFISYCIDGFKKHWVQ